MSKKAYLNARVYTGAEILENASVYIENGIITGINSGFPLDNTVEVVDLAGASIAPAFIDLQIYGGKGRLFNNEPTVETIQSTWETAQEGGTSHFQITLSCSPQPLMWEAIDACRRYWEQGGEGLLGLHLEGPYFNPEKRGAHPLQHIRKPHPDEVAELIERGKGVVSYMTIAPEQFDDISLELLLKSDIHIAAGHSNATFQEAMHGFEKGIERATHLFNAMSAFQSRAPGMVGAIYAHEPWASIIADGIHCDYNSLKISKKVLKDKLFLITDAVTDSLTGDYRFRSAGTHYVDENGILAGSALTMWQAVRNAVEYAGIPLDEALRMASTYPAIVVGQGHRLGRIAVGYEDRVVRF